MLKGLSLQLLDTSGKKNTIICDIILQNSKNSRLEQAKIV